MILQVHYIDRLTITVRATLSKMKINHQQQQQQQGWKRDGNPAHESCRSQTRLLEEN